MPANTSAPDSLFSPGERTRTGPAPYDESEYESLDRSGRASAAVVRSTLDEWFRRLPEYARRSVRNSFVSPKTPTHRGALLELYLHETYLRLGLDLDLDVGREDPARRRPDFLLEPSAAGRTWVEATAVLGADVFTATERARVEQLYELLNRVKDKRFLLLLEVTECGATTLGRRHVLEPLEAWLAGLDPAAARGAVDRGGEPPECRLTPAGWDITIGATPVREDMPLEGDERVLGSTVEGISELDDITPMRRNLKRKATRYGALDAPYVIAALCVGSFVEDRDIAAALLGDVRYVRDPKTRSWTGAYWPNGLWTGPSGPVNTRVSGVLTVPQLSAFSIATVEPTVWTNPWAERPVRLEFPWRRQEIASAGRITTHEATRASREVLGLPVNWPATEA